MRSAQLLRCIALVVTLGALGAPQEAVDTIDIGVRKKDTLSKIFRRFNLSQSTLQRLLKKHAQIRTARLYPGQKVRIQLNEVGDVIRV